MNQDEIRTALLDAAPLSRNLNQAAVRIGIPASTVYSLIKRDATFRSVFTSKLLPAYRKATPEIVSQYIERCAHVDLHVGVLLDTLREDRIQCKHERLLKMIAELGFDVITHGTGGVLYVANARLNLDML